MSFVRQLIEKKISNATGASVSFGEFKFSPLSGTVEAHQVKVAAERFVPPFLSIDRIEAHIAVARALRGEIVIRGLVIDRPVLIYAIHADGKTNVSQKPKGPVEAIVPKEGSAGSALEFNAEKIALNHGRIEFRDATRDNYKLSIEGINATLTPEGSDIAVALTADSVGRLDRPVDVGTIKMLGKLSGGGFTDPLASSFNARASVADSLVLHITSTMLANRAFDVEMAGAIKLATLIGLLPLSLARSWEIIGNGNVDLRGKISLDLQKNLHITSMELKAGDFNLNRTFGHHAAH